MLTVALREHLVARGRPEGWPRPFVVAVGLLLDELLAHTWTQRCFETGATPWAEWLRFWRERDQLPDRADLVGSVRRWHGRRPFVRVVTDLDLLPRQVGVRSLPPVRVPGADQAELACRIAAVLGLRVPAAERPGLMRTLQRRIPDSGVRARRRTSSRAGLGGGVRGAHRSRGDPRWLRCRRRPRGPRATRLRVGIVRSGGAGRPAGAGPGDQDGRRSGLAVRVRRPADDGEAGGAVSRRVLLHVGCPKTGTSYLQDVLFRNQKVLREHDILYPADRFDAHFLAALDLMTLPWGGLETEAVGAWDRLAEQVREWHGTAIISHEIFARATPTQVARALDSLGDAEVHLVLSVRDLVRQIPAEWQENVKHRSHITYACSSDDPRPSARLEDRLVVLGGAGDPRHPRPVGRVAAAAQVHLVTVPPSGADRGELWRRSPTPSASTGSTST